MSLDDQLVSLASGLVWGDLPGPVRDRIADLALDCLGCAIGASRLPVVAALARTADPTAGEVRLPWPGAAVGPADAAIIVSTAAHALDFDDTHLATSLHPTAPALGATLALAQFVDASVADWLAALLVGVEAACRLGEAAPPEAQYARGFHPSATAGALAAAAASARLLRLPQDQVAAALGIALGGSGGTMQFLANDAASKPLGIGFAARTGLTAARLAAAGVSGAAFPVTGRNGFARMFGTGSVGPVAPVPDRWAVAEVGVKPFPSCRRGHALIEAAFALRREHPTLAEPGAIARIAFGAGERSLAMIGRPLADKVAPRSMAGVQFSGPACIALALLRGRVGPQDLEDALSDPDVQALARLCVPVAEARAGQGPDTEFAGSLAVTLRDGRELSRFVRAPSGEPDDFMTPDQLVAKVDGLAAYAGLEPRGRALRALLREPDRPLADLLDVLCGRSGGRPVGCGLAFGAPK